MSSDGTGRVGPRDRVEETHHCDDLGVKVEKVVRTGLHGDETELLKVYGKRTNTFASLEGGDQTVDVDRWVKIDELTPQGATEVLFGLAEVHGYELEDE